MAYEKKFAKRDLNKVILSGNIGKIQDLRYFQNGNAVLNFSLAVSDDYETEKGITENTIWIECSIYGKFAEGINNVIKRWKSVTVVGKLKAARPWTTNNGEAAASNKLDVTEIFAGAWKDKEEGGNSLESVAEEQGGQVSNIQF